MQKLTPLKIYGPVNQPNHVLINEYKPNEGIMVMHLSKQFETVNFASMKYYS